VENKKDTKYVRQLILQQSRLIANEFQLPEEKELAIEDALNAIFNQIKN
jgi:hypothetical protein